MATVRNKRKLTALNKKKCTEHPSSILAQNSNVPRPKEVYITQVSEEFDEESQRSCRKSSVGRKMAY